MLTARTIILGFLALPIAQGASLQDEAASRPASAPDTVIVRKSHTDAYEIGDREVAARDTTQTIWMRGRDHMRMEEGDRVVIVRADRKKIYVLNGKDKTASTLDLPVDLTQYLPEELRERMKENPRTPRVPEIKATDETKKVGEWDARKHTLEAGGGQGGGSGSETLWISTAVGFDTSAFSEFMATVGSLQMNGAGRAQALKKIPGVPVLVERVRTIMETEVKSRDEITKVEIKPAPDGAFEVPADYKEKPYNPISDVINAGRGGRGGRGEGGARGDGARRGRGGESRPASGPSTGSRPAER